MGKEANMEVKLNIVDKFALNQVVRIKKLLQSRLILKKIPEQFIVNNKTYKTLQHLGTGIEGAVFLVSDNVHKYSVKSFHLLVEIFTEEDAVNEAIKSAQMWDEYLINKDLGINIRKLIVYERAEGKPYLLMEYVEGLTLYEVLHSKIAYFLPLNLVKKVRRKFLELSPDGINHSKNIILETSSGEFVLIDPF